MGGPGLVPFDVELRGGSSERIGDLRDGHLVINGSEPWSYLRDLFCLLPRWPSHRVLELAPVNWPATSQRDDVQRLLDRDPYRVLTLGG